MEKRTKSRSRDEPLLARKYGFCQPSNLYITKTPPLSVEKGGGDLAKGGVTSVVRGDDVATLVEPDRQPLPEDLRLTHIDLSITGVPDGHLDTEVRGRGAVGVIRLPVTVTGALEAELDVSVPVVLSVEILVWHELIEVAPESADRTVVEERESAPSPVGARAESCGVDHGDTQALHVIGHALANGRIEGRDARVIIRERRAGIG